MSRASRAAKISRTTDSVSATAGEYRPRIYPSCVAAYCVAPFDAIDEIEGDGTPYRPVRRYFGIASFGVSSFTGRKSGDRIINEHSEEDDQEELYLVLQGRATFELGGEQVDVPTGTFVFAEPGVKRT